MHLVSSTQINKHIRSIYKNYIGNKLVITSLEMDQVTFSEHGGVVSDPKYL